MVRLLNTLKSVILISLLLIPLSGFGQYTTTSCQTVIDALVGPDRNDWSHNNLPIVNEGYLHNFDPPMLPCGINNPGLTSVVASIELLTINTSVGCNGVPIFGNVLLNCPLLTTSVCPIVQDVLSTGCGFGSGQTNPGLYSWIYLLVEYLLMQRMSLVLTSFLLQIFQVLALRMEWLFQMAPLPSLMKFV